MRDVMVSLKEQSELYLKRSMLRKDLERRLFLYASSRICQMILAEAVLTHTT
jgi:hypothetical protein